MPVSEPPAVNIRKFVIRAGQLDDLVNLGSMSVDAAQFLRSSVVAGLNILVSGGTQAGIATLPLRHPVS